MSETRHPAMGSKLVTQAWSPQSADFGLGLPPAPARARTAAPVRLDLGRIVDGAVDRGSPAAEKFGGRSSWRSEVSPGNKTSVISGREGPRPRNTTPNPYPALCRAGSRDGQFGGNALGRACSLTCRNSRRNHTAGTSEAPATSLQAPRISHIPRMRDRCPIERCTHGNTVWNGTARSTAAARIR
jgi:hypothetical protein